MRVTLLVFFALFFIAFMFLLIQIYLLDKRDGNRFRKAALAQQSYTNSVLDYQRGAIRDRNGTTLAVSVRKYDLILEPRTLNNNDEMRKKTVDTLSDFFDMEGEVFDKTIDDKPNSMYEHVEGLRELDEDKVEEFRKKMSEDELIDGVWFEETYTRNYPLNNVACNIVGFLGADNQGTYGIEESYNEELNGTPGREYGYFDSNMNLQRTVKNAKDGNEIIMTIDAHVQQVVEDQIRWFQKSDTGPAKHVGVMLMNPKNGEILAMASENTFDLNNPRTLETMYSKKKISKMSEDDIRLNLMKMWSNYCIGSAYEPGSTYKPFTIAAALDEDVVDEKKYSVVCKGVLDVAGQKIHCANRDGHGELDLQHVLMESCNIGVMDMAEKLGRSKFYTYTKLYGFGQRTGVDLPGETSGQIHDKESLNPVELATSSFGQTQTVTMVQMLSGFCSLVNGGKYYLPHLVREIRSSEGDLVEKKEPVIVKETTSEETSLTLRKFLKATVEEGTATPAAVPGYDIGGKTGTAEKRPISEKNYIVSFIGAVPIEDPQVAVYVIIDEPHVDDQAHSSFATSFASRIMKKVLPFLGLYSDEKLLKKQKKEYPAVFGNDAQEGGNSENNTQAGNTGGENDTQTGDTGEGNEPQEGDTGEGNEPQEGDTGGNGEPQGEDNGE